MNDTPRTDAVQLFAGGHETPYEMVYFVDAEFARQLEREVDALKEQLTEKERYIYELENGIPY